MKAEWRLFGFLTAFVAVVTPIYAWWTHQNSGHVEWVGTVALILTGTLCLMCAAFFLIVTRRIDPRPEDRPDAEIVEGAGELGFFSPGSYWPFGIAAAAFVTALGLVYMQVWLIATGIASVLLASGGLLFEYYTGSRRTEH
jgi:cytosine/uracil/thiamine/allantoin permease